MAPLRNYYGGFEASLSHFSTKFERKILHYLIMNLSNSVKGNDKLPAEVLELSKEIGDRRDSYRAIVSVWVGNAFINNWVQWLTLAKIFIQAILNFFVVFGRIT